VQTCPRCNAELADQSRFCPFDGTALGGDARAPRDPLIGLLVGGRYRLVSRLGEGGMAIVYLADHVGLGKQVAFKVMRPELAADGALVARFAREARAAGRIDHENVVAVFDFGRAEQGFPYLVMEQVSGRPLDSEIARTGPLGVERPLHILAQIAAGLSRAHALGIVHRDLKPENVMLCDRGSDADFVKILDFGLARAITPDTAMPALTRPNELFGTPEYMAPERWLGVIADVRSDIYAIGVIAYELVSGKRPFSGPVTALASHHLMTEPRPPSELCDGVPPPLEAMVLRCLRKKPEERFQSADELLGSLGALWRSLPPNPRRVTYAATRGARPLPREDQLCDPTIFQSATVDPTWDGPTLCGEIRRLHALRRKRLRDLALALWADAPPPQVQQLLSSIDEREQRIDALGEEVAILETVLSEKAQEARGREAELRVEMIDANLALTVAFDAGDPSIAQTTLPGTGPSLAAARLRQAERRLASLYRRVEREELDLRWKLSDQMTALRALEIDLGPLYEELGQRLERAIPRGSPFADQLAAFQKLDGAVASYQALLEALTEESRA
jgi:serine/threonine protein kinase